MNNFDFLKKDSQFNTFSDIAISAENLLHIDVDSCVMNCRRAMEFAIKWMYSVDDALVMPYQDNLYTLMSNEDFRDIVGDDIYKRINLIRRIGNNTAHSGNKITTEQAELCLENLFIFLDFIAYCYGADYSEVQFDKSLLTLTPSEALSYADVEVDLTKLIEENKSLKEELTKRRQENQQSYVPKPLDISEFETRKVYIDFMVQDAGWVHGKNWVDEVELHGMPNHEGVGYADYVLYGDDGRALAIIEAKRTSKDVAVGRQQAKLYADILEKMYGRRPVVFLTNGFDTRIIDNVYPERRCASIYSKRDLEKLFNLQTMRTSLRHVVVDKSIAGRYYQEGAIKAVCDSFDIKNRRKALLVMATGSGKTRTVIALCKALLDYGWVKNILFLADRNSLVTQAKRSFVNFLPDLSVTNLCEDKSNYNAHCVFSTYQTMINCIDTAHDDEGKLFTSGHFDLVICDEAHRSIYNKYRDIFNYFDAHLVGLTATPKDEIDKNTYEVFELENGVPTYGYELAQAVKDEYLVDFITVETKLKFIEEGIAYDELSDDEREEYENTFEDENGELPVSISSSALNDWVFNKDTIRQVLNILMENGIKIDYGQKLGKTIIFAKNHNHAEEIYKIFNEEYPHLVNFAKVIDNRINYAQTAIDEFSDANKLPQIAISVDMLDTGIDVPEVVNLVFFKKVMSKAKFWQMIGRGTRKCDGLIDGADKKQFYIFDFCGNFEFFRMSSGKATPNMMALQSAVFHLKSQIAYKLQDLDYQTPELITFRKRLVDEMVNDVKKINRDSFMARQHIRYVDEYSNPDNYNTLTYEATLSVKEELAPLIIASGDDAKAVRFDALMYGIELAYLVGKTYSRARRELIKKVSAVAGYGNFPEVMAQSALIDKILHTDYVDNAGINEFEHIRESLRNLMKYIPVGHGTYEVDYTDDLLAIDWRESELENDDLKNYKAKAEFYIMQHQDNAVINKLKTNKPLTSEDIKSLEHILWHELGTKKDYTEAFSDKPIGELVREVVGLDMNAAKEAFSEFLSTVNLDSRQIYFVNQIIEYVVQNGLMKDLSVLQAPPFTDQGNITDLFTDMAVWFQLRGIIDTINSNAIAA